MPKHTVADAHQHFWSEPTLADYPWMTEAFAVIRRPFGPEDLHPHLATCGIDLTVLVQTKSSLQETWDFLNVAGASDFVAGVVGWVDLADLQVRETLKTLRSCLNGRWLVGIRHQVHDEPDPNWLLGSDVRRGIKAVGEAGLPFDFLVRPRELPAALRTARDFLWMRFVIDHMAKPPIRTRNSQEWTQAMAPISKLENVYCKLSGMVTEADWHAWRPDDLVPYIQKAVDWFGEDRLMFGSDWPVCLVAGSYAQVYEALLHALRDLSSAARSKILGKNAIDFYRLGSVES